MDEYSKIKTYERLGQWFYNKYDKTGVAFPTLFYETDTATALHMIYNRYYK